MDFIKIYEHEGKVKKKVRLEKKEWDKFCEKNILKFESTVQFTNLSLPASQLILANRGFFIYS